MCGVYLWSQRSGGDKIFDFKGSLVYGMSGATARVVWRNLVSENKKARKKNKAQAQNKQKLWVVAVWIMRRQSRLTQW